MLLQIHTHSSDRVLEFSKGVRLSEALSIGNHPLDLPCAGKGRCGKCRVVCKGALSAPSQEEQALLTKEDLAAGVRLSCQAFLLGDGEVWLSKEKEGAAIQWEGVSRAYELKPAASGYGIAVDIGTTTIAAVLSDLTNGVETAASACEPNPQSKFGADVISRIERSLAGDGPALASAVFDCVERLIQTLCKNHGLAGDSIAAVYLTGNTTMLYLLTGRNVDCLSHAPFDADERFGMMVPLSFSSAPRGVCYLTRCNSAFVGGDITTAVLASGIAEEEKTALLIDVGTNGEIVLSHKGKLYGASTAAGPALEGAGIYMGMPAVSGAIREVSLDNERITVHTVGNAPDMGICGSGVIDAMALLLDIGAVDETGLLLEEDHAYLEHIADVGGALAFRLGEKTLFTQKDIRAVQLAKSAICAGILTLLHNVGLTPKDVDRFTIAGGFGSHINVKNAARIGLFPKELAKKAEVLGNAALVGTSMLLLNRDFLKQSEELADQMATVELSTDPYFSDQYLDSMLFE